jgi:3-oxoacyl-[acyl-carrier-protein] synthase II
MTKSIRDSRGRPLIAITGCGVVTSLGQGVADNWTALTSGRSGIRQISRFPTEGLRTTIAGSVDFLEVSPFCAPRLTIEMASLAAREAVAQAQLADRPDFPGPLFLATPPSELEWPQRRALWDSAPADSNAGGYKRLLAGARREIDPNLNALFKFSTVADHLADQLRVQGLPSSVSTACASGATAIQLGVEAIRRGEAQAALCVGADSSIQIEALIRFSLLSALSTRNAPPEKASRPFSRDRDGFIMAEGAGALVLEDYDAAKARGATILGFMRGCGEKSDDYHRTRSRPDGSAIIGAIRNALTDADAPPDTIDYINAHGTSTPENDKMEYLSLHSVLGDHLTTTPISSNKSMIGHTLSAAGVVEAVFSLMTIRTGRIPPTINYDAPDPEIPLDVVPHAARDASVSTVLSNSFGFGGQNACLVLGAA